MTPEKVVELAKQSGLDVYETLEEVDGKFTALQRFAQLVRNETLEEAANACEELAKDWGDCAEESGMHDCKRMIRSLKS